MTDDSLDRRLGADADDDTRDDGFGDVDRTPAEAADAAVNLEQPDSTDNLPWSPPDSVPIHGEFGDDAESETIDQRIAQEVPEEGTAYGAPEPGGVLDGPDGASARREVAEEDPYEDVEVDVLDDQA